MAPRMKVEVDSASSEGSRQDAPTPKTTAPKAKADAPVASAPETRPAPTPAASAAPRPRVEPAPATSVQAPASPVQQPAAPQATAQKPAVSVEAPANLDQGYATGADYSAPQQPAGNEQFVGQDAYTTPNPQPVQGAQPAAEPQPAQSVSEPHAQKRSLGDTRRAAANWVHTTFPGHEHAFYGGLIALLVAILIFIIGPLHVLIICVLVVIGVAIGQYLDGDPKIIRTVGDLFNGNREQR